MKTLHWVTWGLAVVLSWMTVPNVQAAVEIDIPGIHIRTWGSADRERVDVNEGESFALVLPSGRIPGYVWQLEDTPGHEVRYVGFQRCPVEPAPEVRVCEDRWTFQAVDDGKTTIRFKYIDPADPDHPAERVEFKVKVHD